MCRVGPGSNYTNLIEAYSSRSIRAHLRSPDSSPNPVIKSGAGRAVAPRGGRPPAFDPADYRGRNVIERSFNIIKQRRGIATRYDQLATNHRAAVVLHAVLTWTKALSDTT